MKYTELLNKDREIVCDCCKKRIRTYNYKRVEFIHEADIRKEGALSTKHNGLLWTNYWCDICIERIKRITKTHAKEFKKLHLFWNIIFPTLMGIGLLTGMFFIIKNMIICSQCL